MVHLADITHHDFKLFPESYEDVEYITLEFWAWQCFGIDYSYRVLWFTDASKTILTLVVALSGRTTGKCGKNHSLSGSGSERGTSLTYPSFKYSSITP